MTPLTIWYHRMKEVLAEEKNITYSATLRNLRKQNPEKMLEFMKAFKQSFDQAIKDRVENPEQVALMETKFLIEGENGS